MDAELLPVHFGGQRIHQERHVVIDDLNDGMGRAPAMFVDAGLKTRTLACLRRARLRKIGKRQGGAEQIFGAVAGDIRLRDVGIELPNEAFDQRRALALDPFANKAHDFVDQLVFQLFRSHDYKIPDDSYWMVSRCYFLGF